MLRRLITNFPGDFKIHFPNGTSQVDGITKNWAIKKLLYAADLPIQNGWLMAYVNFTLEKLEGQHEISSEASAFQREEIEKAKPFLI